MYVNCINDDIVYYEVSSDDERFSLNTTQDMIVLQKNIDWSLYFYKHNIDEWIIVDDIEHFKNTIYKIIHIHSTALNAYLNYTIIANCVDDFKQEQVRQLNQLLIKFNKIIKSIDWCQENIKPIQNYVYSLNYECYELVIALNALPGIETVSSYVYRDGFDMEINFKITNPFERSLMVIVFLIDTTYVLSNNRWSLTLKQLNNAMCYSLRRSHSSLEMNYVHETHNDAILIANAIHEHIDDVVGGYNLLKDE